ncbi:MAG: response regulator [Deltaproteobacteria bacterium]|nr:response regulator [Deltaproteobacteria bacterium]
MRVLVVEDEEVFRRLLERHLTRRGAVVVTVGTMRRARERLAEDEDFDAVLTDLNLPDGKGVDVLQPFAADRRRPALIVMTGADRVAHPEGATFETLLKPFTMVALDEALARVTRHANSAA